MHEIAMQEPGTRRAGWWAVIAAGLLLVLSVPTARAAGDANAAKGIVQEHCVGCHEVPGYTSKKQTVATGAVSFPAMANDPEKYPPEDMRTFLQQPHWPMRVFRLSASDIDNLLAFIASMKGK